MEIGLSLKVFSVVLTHHRFTVVAHKTQYYSLEFLSFCSVCIHRAFQGFTGELESFEQTRLWERAPHREQNVIVLVIVLLSLLT